MFITLFPFILSSPLESDTQPHAYLGLLVLLLAVAARRGRMKNLLSVLLLGLYLSVLTYLLGSPKYALAVFFVPTTVYALNTLEKDVVESAFKVALVLYYYGIFLEIVAPEFVEAVVSNYRNLGSRGFNSFTSEPSYLGLTALLLLVGFLRFRCGIVWCLAALGLVFLSGSLTVIGPTVFLIFVYLSLQKEYLLVISFVFFSILAIIMLMIEGGRFAQLVSSILQDPQNLFADQSFNVRISRAFNPIINAINDFFVPHTFEEAEQKFFDQKFPERTNFVSNFLSYLFYILGFFALVPIFVYLKHIKMNLFSFLVLTFIVLVNLSFVSPITILFLSILCDFSRVRIRNLDHKNNGDCK
ncbi:hypothetical protein [Maritalea myrionectae]|uniref:hypothetical protein n=1 Tax=Maritalea myrionectae TaxID=454601 RepID=UPI00146B61FF|nr:hypothetical protein [Maritalea myrionectae]